MTVVRVVSEPGRFNEEHRAELAESLTKAVLDVEVGSDNEVARRGIMVLFDEQPSDTWAVGGRFDDRYVASGGRILIRTQVMDGVWTAQRRRALIERFSAAVASTIGTGEDRAALATCWVLFDTIDDGSWGALGGPISLLDLLEPGGFAAEQAADARKELARE